MEIETKRARGKRREKKRKPQKKIDRRMDILGGKSVNWATLWLHENEMYTFASVRRESRDSDLQRGLHSVTHHMLT